jgi:hypothetical protein
MAATVTPIHVNDQWTLLQVRGDLGEPDTTVIADAARSERRHSGHLAIDLANAHHVPDALPAALAGIDYVVVLTEVDSVAEAFRAAGVRVYESLDVATGDFAPLLKDAGDLSGGKEPINDLGDVPFDAAGSD